MKANSAGTEEYEWHRQPWHHSNKRGVAGKEAINGIPLRIGQMAESQLPQSHAVCTAAERMRTQITLLFYETCLFVLSLHYITDCSRPFRFFPKHTKQWNQNLVVLF